MNKVKSSSTIKILEIFHYFNINSELDSVYGNWAVAKSGDIVNYLYSYAILAIHIDESDWIEDIKKKKWFKPECEKNLFDTLKRAKELIIMK